MSIRSLAGRIDDSWLLIDPNAPDDVAGTLALQATGHCVFHGETGCGVYASRPESCSHFPYVCLIDQRGVHVTLSHYCPTAAALLFEDHGPIAIVEGPSPVPGSAIPEGLDARESLPPTFTEASTCAKAAADRSAGRPKATKLRLMSWDEVSAWERDAVVALATSAPEPDRALMAFEQARRAVAAPLDWPAAPANFAPLWHELVAPAWSGFAPVLARYRAAKVFASWALYLGDGPAAVTRAADAAMAVLQVEAARQCERDGATLDASRLREAIRQTDLLLVHYAAT